MSSGQIISIAQRRKPATGREYLRPVAGSGNARPRLAEILLEQGAIDADQLVTALALQRHQDLPVGEIMLAHGMINENQMLDALAKQFATRQIDPGKERPDPSLARYLPAKSALAFSAVPWRRVGSALVVATTRLDNAEQIRASTAFEGPILMALIGRDALQQSITEAYGDDLARLAEARTPGALSCRSWNGGNVARLWIGAGVGLLGLSLIAPQIAVLAIFALAIVTHFLNTVLKASILVMEFLIAPFWTRQSREIARDATGPHPIRRMPVVTLMLPLLRERDIAGQLVDRIMAIDYPRELLDVLLLVEENDSMTLEALAEAELPAWMRPIIVPPGQPRTKPRALNYGLNYARGSIVGIYDAEDAPEPDQIRKVAKRFVDAPSDVVCLQGQLDYYNPRHNWLSRCFTLEYATWFRLNLPGVQRLGLAIPLGGTTLFFRRGPLEDIGAWDAHNVTEDADLGLRLVRRGYRTEMIETTTFEEANSATWAWIKQRSRWLKGYAMTWATHMRDPVQLWRDLGAWRFFGLQVQFLCTVTGFATAPLLWSFGVKFFGMAHPLDPWLGTQGFNWLLALFLSSMLLSWIATWRAARLARHRWLRIWIPTLGLYFMLASAATLMGLWELLHRPFHWRKTEHGGFSGTAFEPQGTAAASSLSLTSNAVER